MPQPPDPLWSTDQTPDADLARLETLLRGFRHVPVQEHVWGTTAQQPVRNRWRLPLAAAAACVMAVVLGITLWLPWRLQWQDGAPWQVSTMLTSDADSPSRWRSGTLSVGESLVTAASERASVGVARIGNVELSPDTHITLTETATGRHRVWLQAGHIHARIWAPPGYFGVLDDNAEVVDLGCEFDLWKTGDGHGRLAVGSGWVMHSVAGQETLVPAGHAVVFDGHRAGIPLRPDAPDEFARSVAHLDTAMATRQSDSDAEARIARLATADDAFTLLSLMTRYPQLAAGPLYPRLATMLGVSADDTGHRQAWAAGGSHAINLWWDRIPRPPKQ